MKKYKIIVTCLIALGFLACEKENLATFSGKDLIYFRWAKEGDRGRLGVGTQRSNKIDSISVTFAYGAPNKLDTLIKIPIKIQGFISSQDRLIKVKVIDTSSTAKLGVHYTIPDKIIIPADSIVGNIPITFMRTPDMKKQIFSLKLQLLENKNFKTTLWGTKDKNTATSKTLSYTEFTITISDILIKPDGWRGLEDFMGHYSAKKLHLFAEVNKISVPNYSKSPDIALLFGKLQIFKGYLIDQKRAGTPVLEEDGTEMTLGRYL
ncbi:MAG: DUF4843 domain-containing protein [Polaribacter sp.]